MSAAFSAGALDPQGVAQHLSPACRTALRLQVQPGQQFAFAGSQCGASHRQQSAHELLQLLLVARHFGPFDLHAFPPQYS